MTSIEQVLADIYAAVALEAPDDLGLLSRVQVASLRRSRSRHLGAVVVALTAVTAVAVGASVLPGGTSHANRFADPTGFLVDNRDAASTFPLTPSYLPSGAKMAPQLDVYTNYGEANYLDVGVDIRYASTPSGVTGTPTTFGGKPGQLSCPRPGDACRLSWQRSPGTYVTVQSDLSEAETRRIAQGLRDQPIVQKPKIVFGLLPATGCHLTQIIPNSTVYNPIDGGQACPVSVQVLQRNEPEHPVGPSQVIERSASIGGYSGKLIAQQDQARQYWQAILALPDGRRLVVNTPQGHGWNRNELDRFVRAIIVP